MTYGSIQTVRILAGIRPQKAYSVKIGVGDGSETEFEIPHVGRNEGFILDQDAVLTIDLTISDITIYSNGVPVTVSSLDNEKGTVVLSTPPVEANIITADFWHSPVSDEDVLECMDDSLDMVDDVIDGSLEENQSETFKYDGNGVETLYYMEKKDVTAITSLTVNGATKTADSDYYIYYYDDGVRIAYIMFQSPPSASTLQNVLINVTRGNNKSILVRLSNLYSAKFLQAYLPDGKNSGEFKKGNKNTGQMASNSRMRMLNKQIAMILESNDRRDILGL